MQRVTRNSSEWQNPASHRRANQGATTRNTPSISRRSDAESRVEGRGGGHESLVRVTSCYPEVVVRRVRTFVQFGSKTVELTPGETIVVGRSARCDVVLDDDLASREHCKISFEGGAVFVEDMNSRNGVLVNGLPLEERQRLHHGDQVTAGRSVLVVSRRAHAPKVSGEITPSPDRRAPSEEMTSTGSVAEILSGSARLALDDGELEVAERSVRNLVVSLRGTLARGAPINPQTFDATVALLLELAERTQERAWLERLLELHVAASRLLDPASTRHLVGLCAQIGRPGRALEDYRALAHSQGGPSEATLVALQAV